jgi:hypothetical protein
MIRKTLSVVALAAAFLAGAMLGPAAVQAITAPSQNVSDHVRISSCVIRLYTTGPQAYDNASHACLGDPHPSVNGNGDLVITRDAVGAIVSCQANIDESLAARQILAGCSGGGDTSIVKFYKADTGTHAWASGRAVASPSSNVWMTWIEYVP